jgi:hypothetical protein
VFHEFLLNARGGKVDEITGRDMLVSW